MFFGLGLRYVTAIFTHTILQTWTYKDTLKLSWKPTYHSMSAWFWGRGFCAMCLRAHLWVPFLLLCPFWSTLLLSYYSTLFSWLLRGCRMCVSLLWITSSQTCLCPYVLVVWTSWSSCQSPRCDFGLSGTFPTQFSSSSCLVFSPVHEGPQCLLLFSHRLRLFIHRRKRRGSMQLYALLTSLPSFFPAASTMGNF